MRCCLITSGTDVAPTQFPVFFFKHISSPLFRSLCSRNFTLHIKRIMTKQCYMAELCITWESCVGHVTEAIWNSTVNPYQASFLINQLLFFYPFFRTCLLSKYAILYLKSLNTESYIWNLFKYAIVYLICIWKTYLGISSKSEQMYESGERVNEQACDSVNEWTVWLYFLCKIKNKINECLCDCDYYKKCSFYGNLHLSKWQFASTFNG